MHAPFFNRHRRAVIAGAAAVAVLVTAGTVAGVTTARSSSAADALPELQVTTPPASPEPTPVSQAVASAPTSAKLEPAAATPSIPARPELLVAASEKGRLVVINSKTGKTDRVLATFPTDLCNALGQTLSISPDSKTVYFERSVGDNCAQSIWSMPIAGGQPTKVVEGITPRVSPDGLSLAYFGIVHQSFEYEGKSTDQTSIGDLVSRNLKTGIETTIAGDVQCGCGGQAFASWSNDSKHMVVQGTNCGCGGAPFDELRIYDVSKANSFKAVPLPKKVADNAAWAYASYMPDGDLFVLEIPKTPYDEKSATFKSTGVPRMLVIDPATGAEKKQITTGYADRWYSGADVDGSGQHLLYLSNGNLMVSDGLARPAQLATGLVGAAW